MRKVLTMLISCFFFSRTYALNADDKDAPVVIYANVRENYRNMIIAQLPDRYDLCGKSSITIKVTDGAGNNYQWYKDNVIIPNETSYQLVITEVGAYRTSNSNTVTIFKSQKPAKPSIKFTE